jgi:hypothetical protein
MEKRTGGDKEAKEDDLDDKSSNDNLFTVMNG